MSQEREHFRIEQFLQLSREYRKENANRATWKAVNLVAEEVDVLRENVSSLRSRVDTAEERLYKTPLFTLVRIRLSRWLRGE